MKKRVVISPSYGSRSLPEVFIEHIDNSDKHWRLALAEYIDSLEDNCNSLDQIVYDSFENGDFDDWYLKFGDILYYKDDKYGIVKKLCIVEVDTSKKWKVGDYDGAEFIAYFEEPVLEDKSLNMYSW